MRLESVSRLPIVLIAFSLYAALSPVPARAQYASAARLGARPLAVAPERPAASPRSLLVPGSDTRVACVARHFAAWTAFGTAVGVVTGYFAGELADSRAERRQFLSCVGLGVAFGAFMSIECFGPDDSTVREL